MSFYNDVELLIDGKNAFPIIINAINNATKSVYINMFIWRDDEIGNKIATSILNAANRGVKVTISKDRYGVVCEKSEECKKSFFHKKQTLSEKIKSKTLEIIYPMPNTLKNVKDEETELYLKITNHPNIKVSLNTFKADHSKYYIIDDNILILGGVNIEDKENGKDYQGRIYQNYMVKFNGKEYVDSFLNKLKNKTNSNSNYYFGINYKENNDNYFEMEKLYLDLINLSKKELIIVMAYFSPLNNFIEAITDAYKRGVNITIMTSQNANYQNDSNLKTITTLLKNTNNNINVYLSPKMLHTKMIINDDLISFGSTNITKKAFNQLNEINAFFKKENNEFYKKLLTSINENINESIKINDYKILKYNKLIAYLEGFLV